MIECVQQLKPDFSSQRRHQAAEAIGTPCSKWAEGNSLLAG